MSSGTPAHRERQRQRVGVRVTAVQVAVRPAVDDEVIAARRARDVVAGVGQRAPTRAPCRRVGRDADEPRRERGCASIQSASSGAGPIRKLGTAERARPRPPGCRARRPAAGPHRQQRPAVVVADVRQAAVVVGEQARGARQPRRPHARIRRRRIAGRCARRAARAGRSRACSGGSASSARSARRRARSAARSPRGGRAGRSPHGARLRAQLRQRAARDVERQRFAEQVRVGAEVVREVAARRA